MFQQLSEFLKSLRPSKTSDSSGQSIHAVAFDQHGGATPPQKPASSALVAVGAILPLLEEMATLLRHTGDSMQTAVQQVSRDFSSIAATSRSAVAASRRGLDEYRDHDQILRTIHACLCAISQVADEAAIVGMNGRLEAARAPQCTAAFNVVANETGHLSEQTALARERIQDAVHRLHAMNRGLHSNLRQTEDLSTRLSASIESAVVGLQFQDLAYQRIVAVIDSLHQITRSLSRHAAGQIDSEELRQRQQIWSDWFLSHPGVSGSVSGQGSGFRAQDCGGVELF